MMTTEDRCDLCGSAGLRFAYEPPTSARGLSVYVCLECGLVQSLPRIDRVTSRKLALSCGADWGNIRYGKGFRTEPAIRFLAKRLDLRTVRHCLDIGANRGSFVLHLREIATQAKILAIEPDENIVEDYTNVDGIKLVIDRIEHVSLPEARFDLVYCSHTLEHLRSPRQVLGQIRRALLPEGVLFLEVPNLDLIRSEDIVEEWFIDKHLYHFSQETLINYLNTTGFRVVENATNHDIENITLAAVKHASTRSLAEKYILLAKASPPSEFYSNSVPITLGETPSGSDFELFSQASRKQESAKNSELAHKHLEQIKQYRATAHKNRLALRSAARHIETLATTQRVVVWGAGRIFDSLVQHGGLDVTLLTGVIDKYLPDSITSVQGCQSFRPTALLELDPDLVVIASRCYFDEIKQELHTCHPGCTLLGLGDLLKVADTDFVKELCQG
ncbi:MAG: class I SAM-dependent methyltransferase [bacterium]